MKNFGSVLSLILLSASISATAQTVQATLYADAVKRIAQVKIANIATTIKNVPPSRGSYPQARKGFAASDAVKSASYTEAPDLSIAAHNGYVMYLASALGRIDTLATIGSVPKSTIQFSLSKLFGDPQSGDAQIESARTWYDSNQSLWFIAGFNNEPDDPKIYLAVSKTVDVAGDYNIYVFSGQTAAIAGCVPNCTADYLHPGYNQDVVALTTNLSSRTGGQAVNAALYVVPIATIASGAPTANLYTVMPKEFSQHLAPALPVGSVDGSGSFEAGGNLSVLHVGEFSGSGMGASLGMSVLTGTAGGSAGRTMYLTTELLAIRPYWRTARVDQAGTPTTIDGGAAAMSSPVQQVQNNFTAVFPVGVGLDTRETMIRYLSATIDVAGVAHTPKINGRVVRDSDIRIYGSSLLNPAVSLSSSGAGVITSMITSTDSHKKGAYPSTAVWKIRKFDVDANSAAYLTAVGKYPAENGSPVVKSGKHNHVTYDDGIATGVAGVFYAFTEGMFDLYKADGFLPWATWVTTINEE